MLKDDYRHKEGGAGVQITADLSGEYGNIRISLQGRNAAMVYHKGQLNPDDLEALATCFGTIAVQMRRDMEAHNDTP